MFNKNSKYILAIDPDDYYGKLLCLDASNGDEIWNHTTGYIDFSLYTAPAISEAVQMFRENKVIIKPGGGGQYGIIELPTQDGEVLTTLNLGPKDKQTSLLEYSR